MPNHQVKQLENIQYSRLIVDDPYLKLTLNSTIFNDLFYLFQCNTLLKHNKINVA